MEVHYPRKAVLYFLVFGVSWLLIAMAGAILGEIRFFHLASALLGCMHLGFYGYFSKVPYLKIEGDLLTKNSLTSRTILLSSLRQVKSFAGDITLKTSNQELTIDTSFMNNQDLNNLNSVLTEFYREPI